MKIKVQTNLGTELPKFIDKGEWVDLTTANKAIIAGPHVAASVSASKTKKIIVNNQLISLGVRMQLPKGFEAHVLPRSSTYNKFGVMLCNSQGIIDSSYCGPEDVWKFNAIAMWDTQIPKGARIAQFRIFPSQKATVWQKIKWLFTRKIEFVKVDCLKDNNRGGFGSTGD